MAAGYQLRKLGQSRLNQRNGPRYVDYMPRPWSIYTLIFSGAALFVFCLLFYDVRSSPTSLLRNAGRGLDALKVQVADSGLFFLGRSAPGEFLAEGGDTKPTKEDLSAEPESTDLVDASLSDAPGDAEVPVKNLLVHTNSLQPDTNVSEAGLKEDVADTNVSEAGLKEEDVADMKKSTKEGKERTFESEKKTDQKSKRGTRKRGKGENSSKTEDLEKTVRVDSRTMRDFMEFGGTLRAVEEFWENQPAFGVETCDFSKGEWVYDETYPLYKPGACPLLDGGFRCVENGRPSDEFQKWRWQPTGCNLPRFDAKKMLERMRGSRMAFVGDSIGRNHWESMLCMLAEGVPNKSRIYEVNGEPITKHSGSLSFRFEDYDCTVEYYRSPHLVPQTRAPPKHDPVVRSVLRVNQIDWSYSKWRDADIVIFNSGHWWSFEKTLRGGTYFQVGNDVAMNMTLGEGFELAMKTVARFVAEGMDSLRSQVFFRSYAPVHFKGGTWDRGGKCHVETKPLKEFPFTYEDRTCNPMVSSAMGLFDKNPVTFLNITYLSDLRPDGHSAIWQNVPNSPLNHQDCSHWCLPGVPDVWNEILFASLLEKGRGKWGGPTRTISS